MAHQHETAPAAVPSGGGWRLPAVVAIVGVAFLIFALTGTQPGNNSDAGAVPRDLRGNAVAYDPGSEPAPEVLEAMDVSDDINERFSVESVGLDVALGELTVVEGEITPPGFESAYLLRNLGVMPQHAVVGTVYVVMHSLSGKGVGPGNYLIDVNTQESMVAPGERVNVMGVEYRVLGAAVVHGDQLPEDDSIWADVPGRLVVITCMQGVDGGRSPDNVVITAELVSTPYEE